MAGSQNGKRLGGTLFPWGPSRRYSPACVHPLMECPSLASALCRPRAAVFERNIGQKNTRRRRDAIVPQIGGLTTGTIRRIIFTWTILGMFPRWTGRIVARWKLGGPLGGDPRSLNGPRQWPPFFSPSFYRLVFFHFPGENGGSLLMNRRPDFLVSFWEFRLAWKRLHLEGCRGRVCSVCYIRLKLLARDFILIFLVALLLC